MTLHAAAQFERSGVRALRLAVVSLATPRERSSWSGTPHAILGELTRRFAHVDVIDTPRLDAVLLRTTGLSRIGLLPGREPAVSDWCGRHLERRLCALAPDAVVVIAAEPKVAALAGRWPMVVISDSFFANMLDYYPRYTGLSHRTRDAGHGQQRRLLDGGAIVLLSSLWAARTAAEAYGRPLSRFRIAPFGANVEPDVPPVATRERGPLRLLFVGYDWARKGADLAVETLGLLRGRLGDVELHMVGCRPPNGALAPGVHAHGPLRKDRPEEMQRLKALFAEASFLFTPSVQEAYGLIFAEACAFGLPSIAVDTGGVGEIIRHGENGLLLPPSAGAAQHADAIAALWADPAAHRAMRTAARRAFEQRVNWRIWGDACEAAVVEAVCG